MQDVLDDLTDFVSAFAYQSIPGSLTILSISPPEADAGLPRPRASVTRVPARRSSDVVSFLLEREDRNTRSAQALRLTA
jgi:hypothetical protein